VTESEAYRGTGHPLEEETVRGQYKTPSPEAKELALLIIKRGKEIKRDVYKALELKEKRGT
jgi:hypothetical protein